MFWGWGRILGTLLNGTLGTVGRQPGACKTKSVTRVCLNSFDAADDDSKNVACDYQHVATVQQANIQNKDVQTLRFGSSIFNAGHEFFQRLTVTNHSPFQSLLIQGQIRPLSDKNYEEPRLATSPKEIPFILKLLLSFSRSSLAQFSDDKHRFKEKPIWDKSQEAGSNENQTQQNVETVARNLKILEPSKHAIVNSSDLSQDKTEESNAAQKLAEERKEVENDLRRTQQRMELALIGIRGLDLIVEGKFEEGFELLKFAGDRGDPESLYNLGVIFERGFVRKKNLLKAIEFYEAAAKLNHAPSCFNLAVIYQYGKKPDSEKAGKLMQRAADFGLPEAVEIIECKKESKASSSRCDICKANGWDEISDHVEPIRAPVDQKSAQDIWTLARAYQFGLSGLKVDKLFALELFKIAGQYLDEARQGYLALFAELQSGRSLMKRFLPRAESSGQR